MNVSMLDIYAFSNTPKILPYTKKLLAFKQEPITFRCQDPKTFH